MKKKFLIVGGAGLAVLLASVLIPLILVWTENVAEGEELYPFLYHYFTWGEGLGFVFVLTALALVATGVIGWFLGDKIWAAGSRQSRLLTLGMALTASLGMLCLFRFMVSRQLGEAGTAMLIYPLSIIVGLLCLAVLCFLIVKYVKERRQLDKRIGTVGELIAILLYFLPLLMIWSELTAWI